MFQLFNKLREQGLDILQSNADKILPIQWVEVLLAYPETEETIPWDSLDGEAWQTLLVEAPQYAKRTQWEKVSKRRKKAIAKLYPELEIPPISALPGLDEHPDIIQKKSPFLEWRGFSAKNTLTDVGVCDCINVRCLVDSLKSDSEQELYMLVCGCGDAGCSGFWFESVRSTKSFVHWTIRQDDNEHDLYFSRGVYEKSAISHLRDWDKKYWHGSDTCNYSYRDHSEFHEALQGLLNERPHLQVYWEDAEKENTQQQTKTKINL
jgi:hypothetical protein